MSARRWHGWKRLLFDTFDETTALVERTHEGVAERTLRRLDALPAVGEAARAIEGVHRVAMHAGYAAVRGVGHAVDALTELPFDEAARRAPGEGASDRGAPLDADAAGTAAWALDGAQAAVVGFFGDRLERRGNALAHGLEVRRDGELVDPTPEALARAFAGSTGRVAVFVHGLACTEWSWCVGARERWGDPRMCYGVGLERDHGLTPVFVRYNTGRHVSENGRDLSDRLAALVAGWPCEVTELVLVGHSMGGLVSRSAAHQGHAAGAPWAGRLRRVVSIGSPHLGAPLEKAVNVLTRVLGAIDAAGAQVPAEVLDLRSAGIKDLRFGYTHDDEWRGRDPDALLDDRRIALPLVPHVTYHAVASTLTRDPDHPVGRMIGDLLVRVPSASGRHHHEGRGLPFHMGAVHGGISHVALANHPEVYAVLSRIVAGELDVTGQPAAEGAFAR